MLANRDILGGYGESEIKIDAQILTCSSKVLPVILAVIKIIVSKAGW